MLHNLHKLCQLEIYPAINLDTEVELRNQNARNKQEHKAKATVPHTSISSQMCLLSELAE